LGCVERNSKLAHSKSPGLVGLDTKIQYPPGLHSGSLKFSKGRTVSLTCCVTGQCDSCQVHSVEMKCNRKMRLGRREKEEQEDKKSVTGSYL
jgi:hypothetical protein